MGWTSYHADYYKNGTVDRKAECDSYWEEGLNRGYFKIEKSVMKGSVYYAAITPLQRRTAEGIIPILEEERETFAVVMLTSVYIKDHYNFGYKVVSEDMLPCQNNCPESILKLLSPTDNERALEWRKYCWQNAQEEKKKRKLSTLPVGTKIAFTCEFNTQVCSKGDEIVLEKRLYTVRGKCKLVWVGLGYKWKPSLISSNYKVL